MTTVPTAAPLPEERIFKIRPDKPFFLTENEIRWRKGRLLIGAVVAFITIVLVFLVAFAFPARVDNYGFAWTQRAPLTAGVPEAGQYVLLSDDVAGIRSNSRIFESLFRTHNIVRIVAVPGDELTYQGENVAVNGVATEFRAQISGGSRLSARYLVVCETGDCVRGEVFTAPSPNVLGIVSYDPVEEADKRLQQEREAAQQSRPQG